MRVEIRPTVAADLPFLTSLPLPHRIRCLTAVIGDENGETILGMGGIGYRPDGTVIAFAQISDAFRKYPVAVHRAGAMGMRLIRASRVRLVIAEAQEDNAAAEPWLKRFGFRRAGLDGRDVFVWERDTDVE